ncbi:sialate O-acetylesterase [Kiritimatiellota bacterium B12222]|nr:sialate O-acetylesterase [Kiritimatiellota bacterium B12222]
MRNVLLILLFPLTVFAQLEMPSIFSDHMVLQQQQPIQVWGKGEPGTTVAVTFKDKRKTATVDKQGNWKLELPPEQASFDPAVLNVTDGNMHLHFEDVLVGEVWLCSGQSNMNFRVKDVKDADIELPLATHPHLRLFKVENITSKTPLFTSEGRWSSCTPEQVADFSAVAYFFGRDLRQILNVPVGLIKAAWGGTPAIAWTRSSAFPNHPLLIEKAGEWVDYEDRYDDKVAAWEAELTIWLEDQNLESFVQDPGISEAAKTWHLPSFNDIQWEKISLPSTIEAKMDDMDGAVWFRRSVKLPKMLQGQDLTLSLGPIADYDMTWVNGVLVGQTGSDTEQAHTVNRRYTIPADLTHNDELRISIRVFDRISKGGFMGDERSMFISGQNSSIPLAGNWSYNIESKIENTIGEWPLQQFRGAPKAPRKPDSPHRPASLANGMLATVAPYSLRGAIWYQGETDVLWEPTHYGNRVRVMFDDWRTWWHNDDMYFGVVQLANWLAPKSEPSDDFWPQLRESQRTLVKDMPHSGLVVTIDLGEANDIHPLNKQDVGRRLSRRVLCDVYGTLTLRGGPELSQVDVIDNQVVLSFDQVGEGLQILDAKKLGGFTLAGEDGIFVIAQAKIEGKNKVVLSSDKVSNPVKIRYGWQNNPVEANLGNKERLPAGPFHMDISK